MENPSIFDRKNGKTGLLSATSVGQFATIDSTLLDSSPEPQGSFVGA
jgi:hypothetical protein